MKPVPIVYFVQSESGLRNGYVMKIEYARMIDKYKPPPNERGLTSERFKPSGHTNTRQK